MAALGRLIVDADWRSWVLSGPNGSIIWLLQLAVGLPALLLFGHWLANGSLERLELDD